MGISLYSLIFTLLFNDPRLRFHSDIKKFEAWHYENKVKIKERQKWLTENFWCLYNLIGLDKDVQFKIDYESEEINAFATKEVPFDYYKVVIEFGLLRVLTNDEILSVIAHELGHVVNGDCDRVTEHWWQNWTKELRADKFSIRLMKKYYANRKNWRSMKHIGSRVRSRLRVNMFGAYAFEPGKEHTHPEENIRKIFTWFCEMFL